MIQPLSLTEYPSAGSLRCNENAISPSTQTERRGCAEIVEGFGTLAGSASLYQVNARSTAGPDNGRNEKLAKFERKPHIISGRGEPKDG
jgi:hypothetical protein